LINSARKTNYLAVDHDVMMLAYNYTRRENIHFAVVNRAWTTSETPVRLLIIHLFCTIQGESKKTDTFDIQMNNKGVSFF
jgi:hypothetical protein